MQPNILHVHPLEALPWNAGATHCEMAGGPIGNVSQKERKETIFENTSYTSIHKLNMLM